MSFWTLVRRMAPSMPATRNRASASGRRPGRARRAPGRASAPRPGTAATARTRWPAAGGSPRGRRPAPWRGCRWGSRRCSSGRAGSPGPRRGTPRPGRAGRRACVPEDGGQGPRLEPLEQPVEDRVPEVLFGPEVVIEITLSGSALPEDVVERSPVVALDGHEPGGHLEDLLLDGRRAHWVYRPVGKLARALGPVKPGGPADVRAWTRPARRRCLTEVGRPCLAGAGR